MVTRRPRTVERKIYFYRWRQLSDDDSDFAPAAAARLIGDLGFQDGARYLESEDGNAICVWPLASSPRVNLRLGVVRRSSLPLLEDAGNVSPLPISSNQGLLEAIHLVFFPNDIVGAEFNFYGPRVSRLATYLREKFPAQLPRVTFDMLLRQDVQGQLDHMQEVRVARLRLHRAHLDLAQQADQSLFEAFRAAEEASQATSIELLVRPRSRSREHLPQRVLNWVKALALSDGIKEAAEVFKVQALDDRTQRNEWFDLLKDQLVVTRSVQGLPDRQRGVEPDAMFQAIEGVYEELRDTLEGAAGVGP